MTRMALRISALALLAVTAVGTAAAEDCSADKLRRVVDEAGARLRVLTAETQPRIQAALRRLKEQKGWTGPEGDEKAAALMVDGRTAELDGKASDLIARIDELSEASGGDASCTRLGELEATSLELQATIRAKSAHIAALLERAAAGERPETADKERLAAASPPPEKPAPAAPAAPPSTSPATSPAAAAPERATPGQPSPAPAAPQRRQADTPPAARTPAAPAPAPAEPKRERPPIDGWTTQTVERAPAPPVPSATPPPALPPIRDEQATESFSTEEIREASRGFFGTISSGLASVMEHAFSTLGRPSAYVLGNEGGGAFIAGVRYGRGTLFLRDGSKREVYWHGPSIGYDVGAAGSKTLFLVYNLKRDLDIFTGYSGVDGSAYLVGGVGMTLLTDGKVVMAPIRSGLGVRLGANIGYIRFTARPTWNPF